MIHVLIADSDPAARKALARLLAYRLGINCIAEAGDFETLIQSIADAQPDLLLLDWRLQGSPALETCQLLQEACTDLRVVLLSVDAEDEDVAKCAGAEFIHKGASPDELIHTLKLLLAEEEP